MAARRYVCKRRGCTRPRERWQSVCSGCWHEAPANLREAYRRAKAAGVPAMARQIGADIARALGRKPEASAEDPRRAYLRTAAMLGERHEIEPAE